MRISRIHPANLLAALILGAVGLALLIFALNMFWQTLVFSNRPVDEFSYADFARIAATGGVPFREIWDIKPPMNTYLLAGFVGLLGNTVLAVRVAVISLNVAFVAATAALAYALTRSQVATALIAFVALIYGGWQAYLEGWEPVVLVALFSTLGMLFAVAGRGRPLWLLLSGFFLACGFFSKQIIAPEGLAAVAFAALYAPSGKRWQSAGWVIVGGLVSVLGFVALFAAQGVLLPIWKNAFANSFLYAFEPGDSNWHFNEEFAGFFRQYFLGQTVPFLLPLLILAPLAWGALFTQREARPLAWVLLLWLLTEILGAMVGRAMRRTYFIQTLPALLMLVAVAVPYVWRARAWVRLGAVLVMCAAFYSLWMRTPAHWQALTETAWRSPDDAPMVQALMPTVNALQAAVPVDGCFWAWDSTGIIRYLANRRACTPETAAHVMMVREAFEYERIRAEYLNGLFATRPTIHTRYEVWGYFPELQRFADRYLREKIFNGVEAYDTIDIFNVDMSAFQPTDIRFGELFTLIGYDLYSPLSVCAGESVALAFTYRVDTPPTRYYNQFVQVLSPDFSAQVSGIDVQPHPLPTLEWTIPNMVYLADTLTLEIPPDTPNGDYPLVVGYYDIETFERLPVYDALGTRREGDFYTLLTLNVGDC